jgi:hypothetical protein
LRVVDGTGECLLLGRFGQQAEDRQTNQESIGRGSRRESERDVERLVLGLRQPFPEVEERRAQLLNRCERELHLSFDPEGPADPKFGSVLHRVLEQCGLAHARLAPQHQHAAPAGAHAVQQPVERLALAFPAEQRPSRPQNRW